MSITVKDATVNISEQTVQELMKAIEKAKEETEFTDDPMPDGDMDVSTHKRLMRERGEIVVSSPWSKVAFAVSLNCGSCGQESLGYRLEDS